METIEGIVKEMRERQKAQDVYHGGCGDDRLNAIRDYYLDIISDFADRIEEAVKHVKERSRRRAERSCIYYMLQNFPVNWRCDEKAVEEYLSSWQKQGDALCEGGEYGND